MASHQSETWRKGMNDRQFRVRKGPMRGWFRISVLLALMVFGSGLTASDAGAEWPVRFDTGRITLDTAGGRHAFTVELASDWRQRAQGLMGRESLEPDHGMLFDFGRSEPVSMWMKNTLVSLDMLFIGSDGRIVNIVENTTPRSLELIDSDGPVRGVLELVAGTVQRLGVKPGDKVCHAIFEEPDNGS